MRPGSEGRGIAAEESTVEVVINGLAGGGDGVGCLPPALGAGVVFVPDTAPGDRVRVVLDSSPGGRRRWRRGRLVEVLEGGPDRREPRCGVSLLCGGCQWHHLLEEAQLLAKQEILGRAFRQARLPLVPPPLVPSPRQVGYRSRARVRWETSPKGEIRVGFRARRSHRLVETDRCPVLVPSLEPVLGLLARHLPVGSRGEAMLLSAPSGQCGAALRGEGLASGAAARLGEALEGALVLVELLDDRGMSRERWGAQWLDLAAEGEPPFWAAPHCFSQANLELNEALRARVRAWASEALADRTEEVTEEPRLVELFAGSGNLTRELASLGSVVAVESDPRAVALGRLNLEDRSITWRQQEAAEALKSGLSPQGPPSLVVLDPPRSGARELLDGLSALAPQRILYVSCDAMTLARDVAILACEGYLPTRVEALDTLPQTAHFEMVVDLRRGSRLRR